MRRWLVLSLGLGIAAAAGYALLTRSPASSARPDVAPTEARHAGQHGDHGAPHDEIGEDSRARLEEILREADAEESRKP